MYCGDTAIHVVCIVGDTVIHDTVMHVVCIVYSYTCSMYCGGDTVIYVVCIVGIQLCM